MTETGSFGAAHFDQRHVGRDDAAQMRETSNGGATQFHETAVRGAFGIQQSVVAFANSDDLPAKSSGRIHSTVNHRIEHLRVTAASIDGDLLFLWLPTFCFLILPKVVNQPDCL